MLTGVILSGKEGLLNKNGELSDDSASLIQDHIYRMKRICSEIIISTNEPKPYLIQFGHQVRIVTDYYECRGPLAGMHAAISLARNDAVWVLDGELPVSSARMASLLYKKMVGGKWEAALPVLDGRLQFFHGIYKKECAHQIKRLLQDHSNGMDILLRQLEYTTLSDDELKRRGVRPIHLEKLMNSSVLA